MKSQQIEEMWAACPIEVKNCLMLIAAECDHACLKHPGWPMDKIHGAAIVAEEAGELVRAALQHKYENGSGNEMAAEAIQTGAMALRFLIHENLGIIPNDYIPIPYDDIQIVTDTGDVVTAKVALVYQFGDDLLAVQHELNSEGFVTVDIKSGTAITSAIYESVEDAQLAANHVLQLHGGVPVDRARMLLEKYAIDYPLNDISKYKP